MIIDVSPTRMELLKLRKRVAVAIRGHKLLKDKRDELMKEFLRLIRENRSLRADVEGKLVAAFRSFLVARAVMPREALETAIMAPKQQVSMDVGSAVVMNVHVPRFELRQEGDVVSYGFVDTSAELDAALGAFSDVLPMLVRLAEVEKSAQLLADEIERTRRRVNALEYVLIPELQAAVKSISMKLSEQERSNIARLMRIKEIVRA
ncbi:MAG: V-type ATP synthase subunit D [Bacillota bacterium]|nr:V-type ATP synthase subunit D [Bacillota bacterium]